MTDPRELSETSRVETTVRKFNADGQVVSETVTTVVIRAYDEGDELPIGMYL